MDCQLIQPRLEKIRPLPTAARVVPRKVDIDMVGVVLANLAVRRDYRKRGVAKLLLQECERLVSEVSLHHVMPEYINYR